jgi:hypothetical protein
MTSLEQKADLRKICLLNDMAWHSMEIRRLTHELNQIGVSGDDIESYMEDYLIFVHGASKGAFKQEKKVEV